MLLTGLLALVLGVAVFACQSEGGATTTLILAPGTGAATEAVTLRLVTSSKPDGALADVCGYFAELLEEYSDGRVMVDIYPGSELLPATAQWEALVTRSIDVFADATYWFQQYVPDVMLSYIDGLWEGYDHAFAVLEDSELPWILAQKIEDAGTVKVLGFLPAGMVTGVINRDRETRYLKDLEGLRVNTAPGAAPTSIEGYTGMVGVPVALEEAAATFLQGELDAVHYPASVIADLGIYEYGSHILYRRTMFPMLALVMNKDSWHSLPADIRDLILNRIMPEVYEFDKMRYREAEAAAMKLIARNVDTVNWCTQEDLDAYAEYCKTYSVVKAQMLMVDPRLLEIIEELRPSAR